LLAQRPRTPSQTAKKLKFFLSPRTHSAALISVSVALSQTPAEAAIHVHGASVSRGVPV